MKNRVVAILISITVLLMSAFTAFSVEKDTAEKDANIVSARQINPTTVELLLSSNRRIYIDFYGDNIFRFFYDPQGGCIRPPKAEPKAEILVQNPRRDVTGITVNTEGDAMIISTAKIAIKLYKNTQLMQIEDKVNGKIVLQQTAKFSFDDKKYKVTFKADKQEYFYGGGVQNGRFSHKGKKIAIENQNSWTHGGVASPKPFYWSTNGYGIMCYTFKPGHYDFGTKQKNSLTVSHDSPYADLFFMVGNGAEACLNNYYQLTGNPVLLPKFGFYEGHLNAYNRDFWKENEKGILFEDGKRYKESQKDNGGIKESLNGEKNNYQFSARAVIDRYEANNMPLGWILPNDGYGAGYGQTKTLDGNIKNLKEFGDYARKKGVEIGLWTQSDLHPNDSVTALLQRDIVKEVCDAGVRVLKTDVAWVGAGYSFGLNGVADVGNIMPYYGENCRPFIISLDGWAGTQRYAGIWTGDQTGGDWEYIRFHIPTYLGAGLSGQPNICSDMDGIFGGKNPIVNMRDFQWKTFTTMQLNMDGWGTNPKYPHILGEPVASVNRWYLKLKSQLMPYIYSTAKNAVNGLPINRAMFLQYPNSYTYGKSTQYQFLCGDNFLVAPIYKNTNADKQGNDIRDNIYLPEGVWIDYFTGRAYRGNCILNNFDAPFWKLPVFVKAGAIIPKNSANNNVNAIDKKLRIFELYPAGESSFVAYNDDGKTQAYLTGKYTTTSIKSVVNRKHNAVVTVLPTKGNFKGFEKEKATQFCVNMSAKPKRLKLNINNKKVTLRKVNSMEELQNRENVYFYESQPNNNKFATPNSDFSKKKLLKNPQLWVKVAQTDITKSKIELTIEGYVFDIDNKALQTEGELAIPTNAQVAQENCKPYTLKPTWNKVANADFYEIMFEGMRYTNIKNNYLLFQNLMPESAYSFKVRAVNKSGASAWSEFTAQTDVNPLEFAVENINATCSVPEQEGYELYKLFNFDESDNWHTKWGSKIDSFAIVADLHTINELDRIKYVPRSSGRNGLLMKGDVAVSQDKKSWTKVDSFSWKRDNSIKEFTFKTHPKARYVKLFVRKGYGRYGSGRELYVFRVPGSKVILPGDINNDGKIDTNDFTSYMNYTGLRKGDSDFDYVSVGDINKNNLIDAYDISVVATQLDGGVAEEPLPKIAGILQVKADKKSYRKGDVVKITVTGKGLQSVNALSFALPYNSNDYEFVSVKSLAVSAMENLTYNRLHTNGSKALYPTFVNIGKKDAVKGDAELFVIQLKAKCNVKYQLKAKDIILVDKNLNTK